MALVRIQGDRQLGRPGGSDFRLQCLKRGTGGFRPGHFDQDHTGLALTAPLAPRRDRLPLLHFMPTAPSPFLFS
jgi:hypothetical protein